VSFPSDAIVSIGGRKVLVCGDCGHLRWQDTGEHVHTYQITINCNNNQN
jgi:hypothetical protein